MQSLFSHYADYNSKTSQKVVFKRTIRIWLCVFLLQNAALCVVLGLSSFAGGVSNAIYAANNAEAIDAISYTCDQSYDINADFCNALKRIRDAEIAAAVSIKF